MENVHVTVSSSAFPIADSVPAGISTVNSVAIGKRSFSPPEYSKVSVCVPTQRQMPGTSGVSLTGTSAAVSASRVANGTIGWLKVTLRKGASGISPTGAKRSTSSAPSVTTSGAVAPLVSVAGKVVVMVALV